MLLRLGHIFEENQGLAQMWDDQRNTGNVSKQKISSGNYEQDVTEKDIFIMILMVAGMLIKKPAKWVNFTSV